MVTSFRHLRDEKSFTDVTLACEGQTCKAHKMVLSACSPYFKSLLEENPSKHPIIILKDVSYLHLQAILEFMYAGEVNVSQEQLPAFLKTAARLKVKGLAEPPPQMPSIKREGTTQQIILVDSQITLLKPIAVQSIFDVKTRAKRNRELCDACIPLCAPLFPSENAIEPKEDDSTNE
ncbi:Longitudinals lacking protein-like [Eumeta japonica]|uniref:Longitudinals lacking protein-like n=1 Tax=Eumeta variegata TaxID=151549 RepID=A0A4C1YB99_EUMVA|nr:Longitudinals lacking protein-like [Eumeta japonica]